jgi:hypothetical protein
MICFFRLIMRRTDMQWGITKGSMAKLGSPVGYIDVTEGSKTMLGYSMGYMDITKGSRA